MRRGNATAVVSNLRLGSLSHRWRRVRRALPPALLALAFLAGLAAAAPHSVHHLGEELEHQPVECAGALAWVAASGADAAPEEESLDAPAETEWVSRDDVHYALISLGTSLRGRSPPILPSFA